MEHARIVQLHYTSKLSSLAGSCELDAILTANSDKPMLSLAGYSIEVFTPETKC